MSDIQDGGAAPEQVDSVDNQDIQARDSVPSDRYVAFETHRKSVNREKRYKSENEQLRSENDELKRQNLERDGKLEELIEHERRKRQDAEKKYAETMGGLVRGNAMAALVDEARKFGFQGSRHTLEALVSGKLTDLEYDSDMRPANEGVQSMIKHIKEVEPRLFGTEAPKVANHNVNPYSGVEQSADTSIKNMKEEDLMSLWEKVDTKSRRLK